MVDVIYFDDGISDAGFSVFVLNHSFDSSVHLSYGQISVCIASDTFRCLDMVADILYVMLYLLHIDKERFFIVLPFYGQFTGMRELITGQLHRHLKTVGVQVTKVIHTYR